VAKQRPPKPLVSLRTRLAWRLWAYLTWPRDVRQLKRAGFRRTSWMSWRDAAEDSGLAIKVSPGRFGD
jgi:hypothetical protein